MVCPLVTNGMPRWVDGGVDAFADRSPRPRSVWNRIPDDIRKTFVEFAPDHEDLTPRELAVKYTDEKRFLSPSHQLAASPRPRT